jgi:four helix bundle protein
MRSFRELKVWEKAHQLTLAVYKATAHFPKEEMYGLTSQIRRSCESIPANIAEGCGRPGGADLGRFLYIALGSASELEYHLLLARDLALLNSADYDRLDGAVVEIKRMLAAFVHTLDGQKRALAASRKTRKQEQKADN